MTQKRIIISGIPRTGKSTLADELHVNTGWPVYHTDELLPIGWRRASETLSTWFDKPFPWIIEGTLTIRALRIWIKTNPTKRPCDTFIWLARPKIQLTKDQQTLSKGLVTIYNQIRKTLLATGVEIQGEQGLVYIKDLVP